MTDNLDNIIEVEKQNIIITCNDSSGSGKKKDQYYITISDDGKYIARLDCSKDESLRLKITHHENFELLNNDDNDSDSDKGQDKIKICDIVKKLTFLDELNPYVKPSEARDLQEEKIKNDNIKQKEKTKGDNRKQEQTKKGNRKQEQTKKDNREQEEQIKEDNRKLLIWSFSISNTISFNGKPTILVAISRVVPNDMIDRDRPSKHLLDKLKEYEELKLKYQNMKEFYYPLHSQPSSTINFDENGICLTSNIGGIVRFLPEVEKTKTSLLITNVKGFHKSLDNLDKPNIHSSLKLKRFLFPPKLKKDIEIWFKQIPCLERLVSCIYKNYFLFNQYKDRIQTMELYSMLTMEAEQSFFTREELKTQKYGTPAYAISLNKLLLAFTRGNKDIRIYSMESGLFIALKSLDDKDEVLFLEFIRDDERLFIITRNDTNHEISIKIWDIFNSSPEDFKYEIKNDIIPKKIDCLNIARSNGMIFFVKEDGKVLNVLENIEFKEFKVFENDDDNDGIKEEKSFTVFKDFMKVDKYLNHWYYCAEDDSDKHKIFDPFEKHGDLGGPKTLLLVDNKEKLVDVDQITPIVNNKEQWVDRKNYEKTSAFIDENRSLQLFIGLTTVQIWRKVTDEFHVLEYIWMLNHVEKEKKNNNNDVENENHDGHKHLKIKNLRVGCRKFELEVTWGDDVISKKIQWPYPDQYVTPIRHACKALEYLNFKKDLLVSYKKQHRFEEMYESIVKIILKFIRDKPEIWKLMDTRYEVMSNLINGGVNSLIKHILFGKDQIGDNILAINYYTEKNDNLIVGYLLEYYSNNAIEHIGWMITVSTTLPLLFQSHLENYVYDLFYKECFAGNNIGINFKLFLDKELTDNSIGINFKLKEDTESNILQNSVKKIPFNKVAFGKDNQNRANEIKDKIVQKAEGKNKHTKVPFNLCVVPLPNFTVNKIEKKKKVVTTFLAFLRRFILPHKYIDDEEKLSSFIQMIGLDGKGLIFDNPAIEALINFRWRPAKIYFSLLFFIFIQYAVCYGILVWAYTTYQNSSSNLRTFLILVMSYFYFTGYHLLLTEFRQLKYYGFRKYFSDKYNILDIIAIIVPLIVGTSIIVKSFEIEDAFGSVKPDQGTIAAISFSVLFLWIEFLSYLRLFEENLLVTVWPLLLFMLIVILAFAHTMYILLQKPDDIGLVPNVNTYSIINTNDKTLYNDITIKADFDSTSSIDNPFSNFFNSIPAAYFWINGNWINRDTYGSYFAVQILSLIASFNVYENTSQQSKLELLKLQATFISDYEALDLEDDFLNPPKPDPKYICYNNNNLDSWKERTKSKRGCLYTKYENENSYIQYILEKKDFDHQDGSLWQIYNKLDDFNDDDVNEKISNLEKKMDINNGKMDIIMSQLQQLQQLLKKP
nr:14033_t:CDS:2 [Entrophospora candida]